MVLWTRQPWESCSTLMIGILVFLVSHGRFSKVNQVFLSDQMKKNQNKTNTPPCPQWLLFCKLSCKRSSPGCSSECPWPEAKRCFFTSSVGRATFHAGNADAMTQLTVTGASSLLLICFSVFEDGNFHWVSLKMFICSLVHVLWLNKFL